MLHILTRANLQRPKPVPGRILLRRPRLPRRPLLHIMRPRSQRRRIARLRRRQLVEMPAHLHAPRVKHRTAVPRPLGTQLVARLGRRIRDLLCDAEACARREGNQVAAADAEFAAFFPGYADRVRGFYSDGWVGADQYVDM